MVQVKSQFNWNSFPFCQNSNFFGAFFFKFEFQQIGETPTSELRSLSSLFSQVIYRGKFRLELSNSLKTLASFAEANLMYELMSAGQSADLRHVSLHGLLPETDHYMTYEGSTTHPGCWETTSWIIFNKPIYITRQEVSATFIKLTKPSDRIDACAVGHEPHCSHSYVMLKKFSFFIDIFAFLFYFMARLRYGWNCWLFYFIRVIIRSFSNETNCI